MDFFGGGALGFEFQGFELGKQTGTCKACAIPLEPHL
jgi:hypothetical protein